MFTGNEQKIIKDIDNMSIDEARKAIAKGQFGRPDRTFASEYLSSKEAALRDKREAESLSISRKALSISDDANRIALLLIAFLSWLKFPDYFKQAKKFSIYFEQKEEVALLQLIYMGFLRHEQESLNNY